jgi:AcrR family transcriptional regulator
VARPRFEKIGADKRELILQAAADEFASYGYEGASINRILEAAGLSKGAFYYYFDDKPDLAVTVAQWAFRDVLAVFDGLQPPADAAAFWETMTAFMNEGLAVLKRSPHQNELMTRLGQAMVRDKELAERLTATFARATGAVVAMFEHGQRLGAVRSDLPAGVLVALLQGLKETLIRAYLPPDKVASVEELERIGALQLDLYRRISAPAGKESP